MSVLRPASLKMPAVVALPEGVEVLGYEGFEGHLDDLTNEVVDDASFPDPATRGNVFLPLLVLPQNAEHFRFGDLRPVDLPDQEAIGRAGNLAIRFPVVVLLPHRQQQFHDYLRRAWHSVRATPKRLNLQYHRKTAIVKAVFLI